MNLKFIIACSLRSLGFKFEEFVNPLNERRASCNAAAAAPKLYATFKLCEMDRALGSGHSRRSALIKTKVLFH